MRQPPPDGRLFTWQEIETAYRWSALLVGNGLSINVWEGFRYGSLYKEALRLGTGGLSKEDRALFEALDTQNFERVLADLGTAIRVNDALERDSAPLLARYQSVQAALGEAIRSVHIPWVDVPAETLATIQQVLHKYEWVFTLNYDLLLYWAMGHNEDYGRLVDCFWGSNCRFDPADADIRVRSVPVYFLHGAMHLIVEASGKTRKLKRTAALTLLDQFGQPIHSDPQARPLMVTEGSWRDKLQAIEANDYLAHAFETLQAADRSVPLVVFGCSLGEQDKHLTNALSAHPDRPIAISMMPGSKRDLRSKQGDIYGRVEAKPLLFFDATTYPLGAKNLAPVGP
jgi:Domain of unknown function (DUF4917)